MNRFLTLSKLYMVIVIILVSGTIVQGQKIIERSTPRKPAWLTDPPKSKYFSYYSGAGSNYHSLTSAREQAIASVLSEIIMEEKIVIRSEIKDFYKETNSGIISEVSREILQKGTSTVVEGLCKEEEYWQSRKTKNGILYEYWVLMKIQKPECVDFDIPIKQGYGFSPVLRSFLIPGWGQFYKGENTKGWTFLTAETILISSAIVTSYLSKDYNRKAENERDITSIEFYDKWSNRTYSISMITWVSAGVLYVYNIFDSIVSKGVKRYALNSNKPISIEINPWTNTISLSISIME